MSPPCPLASQAAESMALRLNIATTDPPAPMRWTVEDYHRAIDAGLLWLASCSCTARGSLRRPSAPASADGLLPRRCPRSPSTSTPCSRRRVLPDRQHVLTR